MRVRALFNMARVLTHAQAKQLGLAGRKSLELLCLFPVADVF